MTGAAHRLQKARESLAVGHYLLAGGFHAEAGRAAYMAAFHAAQAFVQARSGRASKTHSGARTTFVKLARSEPTIQPWFIAFLGRSYELKVFADYVDTPQAVMPDAADSLRQSAVFVDLIQSLLEREKEAGAGSQ